MQVTTIGLDIAKHVFQLHGADPTGRPVLRQRVRRGQVLDFFRALAPCVVGIEACATGGRILASKNLIERLNVTDATSLGIDPNHLTYTQLGDLETATDKARRDAPALAVTDLAASL